MIVAKYNPDFDLLGYDISVNESQLNEIFEWVKENNVRDFSISLGPTALDYDKPYTIRVPTYDLVLEFILISGI